MGRGSGTAILIIIVAIYFTFMGMMANALGYTATGVNDFTGSISSLDVGILSFLFDIIAWVINIVGGYFSLVAFSITGDIPIFIGAIAIVPVTLGMGWAILELIRG